MTNREIVDYILSNKMDENKVIKEIVRDNIDDEEYIMYIFYDGYDLFDENERISIRRFCDEIPNLEGFVSETYTYEVISKEQAIKEIKQEEKQRRIKELEEELVNIKASF